MLIDIGGKHVADKWARVEQWGRGPVLIKAFEIGPRPSPLDKTNAWKPHAAHRGDEGLYQGSVELALVFPYGDLFYPTEVTTGAPVQADLWFVRDSLISTLRDEDDRHRLVASSSTRC